MGILYLMRFRISSVKQLQFFASLAMMSPVFFNSLLFYGFKTHIRWVKTQSIICSWFQMQQVSFRKINKDALHLLSSFQEVILLQLAAVGVVTCCDPGAQGELGAALLNHLPMVIFPSYLVVPPSIWTSERETSFKVGILTCFTVLEFVSGNYSCPSILSVIHMKMSTPRLKAQKIFGVWRQRTTNHKGIWHLKTHLNEIFLSCSLVYS